MKSLQSKDDVRQSQTATESGGKSNRLPIPDQKTPWYLLSLDYADGFVHYVKTADDRTMRAVCGGGPDAGGLATDDCPVCDTVMRVYKEGKRLRGLDDSDAKKRGEELKNIGNRNRGKYEAHFLAIRGVRRKYPGKKEWVADFELPDDDEEQEENPVAVGVLSLTHNQFNRLVSTIDDDNFSFIKGGEDLVNRILWSHKEKKSGNFKEVFWTPDPHQSDAPEVPSEMLDELDISADFEIDLDRLEQAAELVAAEAFGEEDDEEEEIDAGVVELSDDELDDEDPSDDEDVDPADDFEDDIPGEDNLSDVEDDEEEESVAKPKPKKRPDSVSKSKKRKSGRSRL
jgi:hypothetical protein